MNTREFTFPTESGIDLNMQWKFVSPKVSAIRFLNAEKKPIPIPSNVKIVMKMDGQNDRVVNFTFSPTYPIDPNVYVFIMPKSYEMFVDNKIVFCVNFCSEYDYRTIQGKETTYIQKWPKLCLPWFDEEKKSKDDGYIVDEIFMTEEERKAKYERLDAMVKQFEKEDRACTCGCHINNR